MWSEDAAECGVTLDLSVAGESASRRRRMPITEVLNAPLPPPSLLYAPSSFFSHVFSRSDGWMDGWISFLHFLTHLAFLSHEASPKLRYPRYISILFYVLEGE